MNKLLLFLFITQISLAQQTITGKVYDKQTNEEIPFTSVGIKGKVNGTVSDEFGQFSIKLANTQDSDSLKISAIGYQTISFSVAEAKTFQNKKLYLNQASVQLGEVIVKPTKTITKVLGNKKYNKNVQCSFQGVENNYKGVQAAIKANSKKGRLIWFEDFNFFILKNSLSDSVIFRLNLYAKDKDGMPGENILNKPIVFKTMTKNGVVTVDLKKYNIHTDDDFFISLECLTENLTGDKLSFSGSISGPSYFKMASFAKWEKLAFMGLDFNVTVSYQK